jgi:hypothetical protein
MNQDLMKPPKNNIADPQTNLRPTIQNTNHMVHFSQPMIYSPQSPMKSAFTSPNQNNIVVPQTNLKPSY